MPDRVVCSLPIGLCLGCSPSPGSRSDSRLRRSAAIPTNPPFQHPLVAHRTSAKFRRGGGLLPFFVSTTFARNPPGQATQEKTPPPNNSNRVLQVSPTPNVGRRFFAPFRASSWPFPAPSLRLRVSARVLPNSPAQTNHPQQLPVAFAQNVSPSQKPVIYQIRLSPSDRWQPCNSPLPDPCSFLTPSRK
jgi:hypothetical protein